MILRFCTLTLDCGQVETIVPLEYLVLPLCAVLICPVLFANMETDHLHGGGSHPAFHEC